MLFVLILSGAGLPALASEDLFRLTRIDYFGLKAEQIGSAAYAWHEPDYRPPPVVEALLDDPNERTALAYLQWHRARLERMARAQAAIDALEARMPSGAGR